MFCGCEDVVNVVDMGTGKLLRTLAGDSEPVMSIAVSPDDSMVRAARRWFMAGAPRGWVFNTHSTHAPRACGVGAGVSMGVAWRGGPRSQGNPAP